MVFTVASFTLSLMVSTDLLSRISAFALNATVALISGVVDHVVTVTLVNGCVAFTATVAVAMNILSAPLHSSFLIVPIVLVLVHIVLDVLIAAVASIIDVDFLLKHLFPTSLLNFSSTRCTVFSTAQLFRASEKPKEKSMLECIVET